MEKNTKIETFFWKERMPNPAKKEPEIKKFGSATLLQKAGNFLYSVF